MIDSIGGRDVLFLPVGVAWDRDGNLLVANAGSGQITVLDRSGIHLRTFGEKGHANHQLHYPHYIVLTSGGNIVVSDYGNHRIHYYNPDGTWLRSFGGFGSEVGQFKCPKGLACDAHDNLFVVDGDNHRVQVFDAADKPVQHFGTPGSAPGQLREPIGIALGDGEVLFLSDFENRRAQVFKTTGEFVRVLDGPTLEPQGIARRADGWLFIADTLRGNIAVYDPQNAYAGRLPTIEAETFHPLGVAIAPDGLVAVTNYAKHKVYLYRSVDETVA